MSDTKLREKADALIAFTLQGPRFIAWVEAVTDSIAPAPEKAAKAATTADRIAADLAAGTFRGVKPEPEKVTCMNCRQRVDYADQHYHREDMPHVAAYFTCDKPAPPEPAKVECPNCGEMTEHNHSRYEGPGPDKWACQPAPPEPAAPVTGHTPIGEYDPDMKPAAPEMPEAVRNAIRDLNDWADAYRIRYTRDVADALESWWRTHSQPVAHPFKAGFKPDSMRHFAEYVRDNWHYFGTDTAGLAHQFLQEMAAQPVAVGMTKELERVLEFAAICADQEGGYTKPLAMAAIAAVRQQVAQGRKVELGTARKTLEYMRRCAWADATYEQIDAALSELDAAEGRK